MLLRLGRAVTKRRRTGSSFYFDSCCGVLWRERRPGGDELLLQWSRTSPLLTAAKWPLSLNIFAWHVFESCFFSSAGFLSAPITASLRNRTDLSGHVSHLSVASFVPRHSAHLLGRTWWQFAYYNWMAALHKWGGGAKEGAYSFPNKVNHSLLSQLHCRN